MLLWIRNLGFSGSNVGFTISGLISISYEEVITINGEPVIVTRYGPSLTVQYASDVSIPGEPVVVVNFSKDIKL